jgi:HSP20 family protein
MARRRNDAMADVKESPRTEIAKTTRPSNWLWGGDPFSRMRGELDELLGHYLAPLSRSENGLAFAFPARLDMSETKDTVVLKFDLPGMEEKDIEITLDEDTLVVSGQREQKSEEKKENYHRMERSFGSFRRVLPLPCEVVQDKIDANLSKGVLTVTLPKATPSHPKARKISIKST